MSVQIGAGKQILFTMILLLIAFLIIEGIAQILLLELQDKCKSQTTKVYYKEYSKELVERLCADLKNLKYQLNNIKHKPIINKNIQQQLNKECDWKNEEYSNLRSAIIINKFSKNIYRNYVRLPKFFLRILEFFVFKKALKNNAKILNFNYCEFFHSQPNEVSTLVNERLKNGKL